MRGETRPRGWRPGPRPAVLVLLAAGLAALAGSGGSGGCGGTIPQSRYYVLDYTVEDDAGAQPLRLALGVDVFGARPIHRDRRMAYRISSHEVAYYPYRFWAADPGELVAAQLADQLRRRRLAVAVLEQPFEATPDWVISGRVQRFEEVARGERWFAVFELAVRIETYEDHRVLVERVLHQEQPTAARTPEGVAAAMSEAVKQAGLELEGLVRETARAEGV